MQERHISTHTHNINNNNTNSSPLTKAFSQNVSCTKGGVTFDAAVPSPAALDATKEQEETNLIEQLVNKSSRKLLPKSGSLSVQRTSNEVSVDMVICGHLTDTCNAIIYIWSVI